MRKLVLAVIVLLALFAAFRAYSQGGGPPVTGLLLQPGLIEVGDGTASIGLSFGFLERTGGGPVSVLPVRVLYTDGQTSASVGLKATSLLLRRGASIGEPVLVSSPRRGDLLSLGGPVTVDSRVDGDVWVVGADADLSPRARVTGDVVVIGGKLNASPGAAVAGTVSRLADLKIPFAGLVASRFSSRALGLAGVTLDYVLFGFALFVSSFYLAAHARRVQEAVGALWKQSIVTLVISVVVIPVVAALLILSLVGVLILPLLLLAVFLLALDGFMAVCIRVGRWLRTSAGRAGDDPLYLFTSGLLALFLLNAPALAGIVLSALRSGTAERIGSFLQAVSLGLVVLGLVYGFGAAIAFARTRVAR